MDFVPSLKPSAGLTRSDSYASMILAQATTPRNVEILLPDWDASTLIQKAKELQKPGESE